MDKPKNNEPKVYLLRKSDIAGKIDIGTGDKTIINIQKHMKKSHPALFCMTWSGNQLNAGMSNMNQLSSIWKKE